jgi:predicted metal-dependent phosphoesterase TrpH
VVREAAARGLDAVAITDHNSSRNVAAAIRAARGLALAVLPGMEVCSSEEVHVLALFDEPGQMAHLQEAVDSALPGRNDPEAFGLQVIANEEDEVEGFEERLLIGATEIGVDDLVRTIHALGGLAIASHVDRESYSVISQLGFIPRSLAFDALEVSSGASGERVAEIAREYPEYSLVTGSDAHAPDRVGSSATRFLVASASCGELGMALRREGGRAVQRDP